MKHTLVSLVAWMNANLKAPANDSNFEAYDKENVRWFFAYREAESLADETTRHIAQMLLYDLPAINAEVEIDDWYDAYAGENNDDEEDIAEATNQLEMSLRFFFNPNPSGVVFETDFEGDDGED